MPEQLNRPDGQWVDAVTIHQSLDYGHTSGDTRVDAAGNQYELTLFIKWNATIAYLRKYAPNGAVLDKWNIVVEGSPHDANYQNPAWNGTGKIDAAAMCPSGRFMLVKLYAHFTDTERQNPVAQALIDVGYVPFGAGQNPEDGGFPTFMPQGGGEPQVDYEEVQRRAKAALDEWLDSWIAEGEGTRQTLKNMVADSTLHLMRPAQPNDPNRAKVVEWNDRTFDREKNAAANPLANVLGGLDDWGVARRDELKQIIREVLQEIDEPDVEG